MPAILEDHQFGAGDQRGDLLMLGGRAPFILAAGGDERRHPDRRQQRQDVGAAEQLGALLDLMADKTLSGKLAKEVFEAMVEEGKSPGAIVEERGLRQVTDTGAIDRAVDAVLAANADKVAEYRSGKDKLFGFFVGQVMKAMQGKGNPALVNEAIKRRLA